MTSGAPLGTKKVVNFGLRYAAWYVLAWLVLAVLFYLLPQTQVSGSAITIGLTFWSASMTFLHFFKDRSDLPTRTEYVSLVILSTVLNVALEVFSTIVILAQLGFPKIDPARWADLIGKVAITALLIHMLCYSGWFGKPLLKHYKK